MRRLQIGWMNYCTETRLYKQVRTPNGGGTRHMVVASTVSMLELEETVKTLFFPDGVSRKGKEQNFLFHVTDFCCNKISPETTVSQLYEKTHLKLLRLYLASKQKDILETESESSSNVGAVPSVDIGPVTDLTTETATAGVCIYSF